MLKYTVIIALALIALVAFRYPELVTKKTESFTREIVRGDPAVPNAKKEDFEPDFYAISEHSKNTVPVQPRELAEMELGSVQSQMAMLEEPGFALPEEYTPTTFADYTEVQKYDSGSGDISDLQEAYKMLDDKQYSSNLKALRLRGGNVHISN